MQAIGLILALIIFGGIVSGIVFFMTTIGWVIAGVIISLCICAGVVSGIKQLFNNLCGNDSNKNKGP